MGKGSNSKLEGLREQYGKMKLGLEDTGDDPIAFFEKWFQQAMDVQLTEPNAFTLSTVDKEGQPDGRILLLKGIEYNQFIFYTNYESKKGNDLSENNKCAMTFLWLELERQVRIRGTAIKMEYDRSNEYFKKRPRGSRIGALTSPQSKPISKEDLEATLQQNINKFAEEDEIPMPEHWGGYFVEPLEMEFWQGRANRLHDRILYKKNKQGWTKTRIAP